ncbi:protein containing DUF1638 [Candidatus Magnetomorum sp. HK-1]|nr:protein containing DUF1638 [Candidatus Magnetomorum sp. HK-1]
MEQESFSDIAVVSCGTMSLELNYLKQEGFLNTDHLIYITPGLHQDIPELERQLLNRVKKAKETVNKVIVIYGGKFCYVNIDDPTRTINNITDELGDGIVRIDATHCMDMLVSEKERDSIANELAGGEKVWWMTPGWVKFRQQVFKGWDKGVANENFPRHTGGAIVLDGIGYMDQYMAESPEEFLEYCDWMGIPMQAYQISLDRFKSLLLDKVRQLKT